jgi:hypothetical protein
MNYHFDIQEAKKYGVNEAIMINNFRFWIMKNYANNKNRYEGRTWTYNSKKALRVLFPFWTERQIRTILESLINQGVLIKGNFNEDKMDKTLWYAFNNESFLGVEMSNALDENVRCDWTEEPAPLDENVRCDWTEEPAPLDENVRCIYKDTDNKHTDIKPDNKHTPRTREEGGGDIEIPSCVKKEIWQEWIAFRKEKKQKLTSTGTKRQFAFLQRQYEQGADPNEIIIQSIQNGWTGLFELKTDFKREKTNSNNAMIDRVCDEFERTGFAFGKMGFKTDNDEYVDVEYERHS